MAIIKKILLALILIVLLPIAAAISGSIYLMVNEYKPGNVEAIEPVLVGDPEESEEDRLVLSGDALPQGATVRLMTFNIGGGSQGSAADSFIYGGKEVRPGSRSVTNKNLASLSKIMISENVDIYLLQEIDAHSKRSFKIDEIEYFSSALELGGAFAYNNIVKYIPYPFPTYGELGSGLLTLTKYGASELERVSFPNAFSWPLRIIAPKRCMLVTRIPVAGTGRELVVINVQLEALRPESAEALFSELALYMMLEYELGNYVIAGGDFAALFPNADNRRYPLYADSSFKPETLSWSSLPEGFDFVNDGSVPTMRLLDMPYDMGNSEHQFFVTDGYIISQNLSLNGIRTADTAFEFSSHNPVILNVTLN